jgi:hypothetical protein
MMGNSIFDEIGYFMARIWVYLRVSPVTPSFLDKFFFNVLPQLRGMDFGKGKREAI